MSLRRLEVGLGFALLELRRPTLVFSAAGSAVLALAIALGGEPSFAKSGLMSYVALALLAFSGILGGQPAAALRVWRGRDYLPAGLWIATAFVVRWVVVMVGFSVVALAAVRAGHHFRSFAVLRFALVLFALAAWATMLSAFLRRAWNLVAVVLLLASVARWVLAIPGPSGPTLWLAAAVSPVLAGLLPHRGQILLPLGTGLVLLLFTWWWVERAEIRRMS